MSRLTVILPGLCWPDSGDREYLSPQVKMPWLNQLLSFATVNKCNFSYSDFYYSLFLDKQDDARDEIASLALAYARKLGLIGRWHNYLLASPTHLRIDRDRILISESELLQLDSSESQQLIEVLNQHFAGGCEFFYISDELWLVGVTIDTHELSLVPLIDIIGENINDYLPTGSAGLLINALTNEIQMLLHDCVVNNLRDQDGLLVVNGIWLWDIHDFAKISLGSEVISSNPNIGNLIDDVSTQLSKNQVILIDQLYYPSRYRDAYAWTGLVNSLDQDLFVPLFEQWSAGTIEEISVIIPQSSGLNGGVEFRLTKRRFWQRYLRSHRDKVLSYIFN